MSGFRGFWNGLDWSVLTDMLFSVLPALLCVTLHELSHGLAAYCLGDDTAKRDGRLSLNPLRHIDWMGLAMMVVFHFGWAKPVRVDMRRFTKVSPKTGMALTAAAGPLCNLLLSALLLFVYGLLYRPLARTGASFASVALRMVATTSYLSLAMGLFNLIPISPLDGSKVLFAFLPPAQYEKLMRYERYGMILLLVAVATGILRTPLSSAADWLFDRMNVLVRLGAAVWSGVAG